MEIYKLLHETKYLPVKAEFSEQGRLGGFGEKYGVADVKCPSCDGNYFFKGFDSWEKYISCANKDCMIRNKDIAKDVERQERENQHSEKNYVNTLAKRLRLPQRFQHASMSQIKYDTPVMKKLNKWINNPKNFLFIIGAPGTGKTYLTSAILNHFGTQYKDVLYLNMRSLLKKLTDAIQMGFSTYEKIDEMIDHDIVILDDLGASALTEWQKEVIHYFIDRLYENEVPAIVTTNFTENEIIEKIHNRVLDRLYADENIFIQLDVPSFRSFGY